MRCFQLLLLFLFILTSSHSCKEKTRVDLLVYNATIYTVDSSFSQAEAMAISNGKIVAIGKLADMQDFEASEKMDAGKKFIYPGFIDAHAHFLNYGIGLQEANLVGTNSWKDILDTLSRFSKQNPEGWLIGRGWDQNDWPTKEFPKKEKLDELFPDRPVFLVRVDGHAAIANQKALNIAGVKAGDKIAGGDILTKGGQLTGVLIDNAVDLVESKIPAPSDAQTIDALHDGEA